MQAVAASSTGTPGRAVRATGRRLLGTALAVLVLSLGLVPPAASAASACGVRTTCEAEMGTLRGGAAVNNNHTGFTGTGFVDGMGPGAGIVTSVFAPVTGQHDVTIRYANDLGALGLGTRTLTLSVGGAAVRASFPVTGSWSTWSTVTVPITLPAGTSDLDLHVSATDDGNVNVDSITVVLDDGTGTDEQGVTLRVFDVGIPLQRICELKPGQTPNADVLRPAVNWSTGSDWAGYTQNYMAQVVADLEVPVAGSYTFRLTSDDGSRLLIDDQQVIDHDGLHGATAKDGTVELAAGVHKMEIDYFQAGGGAVLSLAWRTPLSLTFATIPNSAFTTEGGGARVTSPGTKECEGLGEGPGDGLPLNGVHPSFTLSSLRPDAGFQPDVSGLAWFDNGDAAVLTWGKAQSSFEGKLYRVRGVQGAVDLANVTYTEIASGLQEPQGVQVVDGDVYVATKAGLDRLVDAQADGFYEGRVRHATWPNGNNFHEFAFGLLYRDGYFYVALSVALQRSGDSVIPQPAAHRGTLLKISKATGAIEYVAGGLRTPNGLGWGPDGKPLVTDNQGGWVPASKLVQVTDGAFFNHPTTFVEDGQTRSGRFDDQPVTKPVVWLPHNEIANSPSTPMLMQEGPFAGQLAIGDVTYGGIQRVSLEQVGGQTQGALYRMSQGLEAGVNELAVGPDGDLYVGGIGYDGNWNQPGKLRYGFQKLAANDTVTMDILRTSITETGFDITYTKPLSAETAASLASRYGVRQWRYNPTSSYGGPKLDEETLVVSGATVSDDGRTVSLDVAGIKPGRVVHIRSPRPFSSADGQSLWSTEVWYTANVVPGYVPPADLGYHEAEEATLTSGASIANDHNGYSGSGFAAGFHNQGATLTFTANAVAAGVQPVHLRYANGPHPFTGTKTVSLYVNGSEVEQLSLPSTGDWQTWAFLTRQLDLRAGSNTISLRYETGDSGNVNFDLLKIGESKDICAPAAKEPGYARLYDGTLDSLTGWRLAGPGSFSRQPDCSLRTDGGLGLLWYTGQEFTSYSLKLDWKLVKDDNGGVFVGFPNPGNDPWVAVNEGYEIQIDATDDEKATTGAVYGFKGAKAEAVAASLKPVGSWNSYEIRVEGQNIKVYLNGTLVNDFTSTDDKRDLRQGFVGLQNHGAGETVYYRNVRIQDPSVDAVPPVTSATTDPAAPNGDNGWFTSPVSVTLTATDDSGTTPGTEHRIDGGAWQPYTGPIPVGDGAHVVEYRSTDDAGNAEPTQSLPIDVDTTAPAVTVTGVSDGAMYGDSQQRTLSWTTTDDTSGIASASATFDGSPVPNGTVLSLWELPLGQHTLTVQATDSAGHRTTATTVFTTTTSVDDLIALVGRFNSEGRLTNADAAQLTDTLNSAKAAAAAGKTREATRAMDDFLRYVGNTKKLVTDTATRGVLQRDGRVVRDRYAAG